MFRISYIHLQEDCIVHAALYNNNNNNNNNLDWGPVPHFSPWKHCSQCGLLYIPVAFLTVPALAARCLPLPQPTVVPLATKGGTMGQKWWPNGAWDMHPGFFYIPKICDMGPIILLPLRRKACWGFLSPLKNPTASAGFELANLGIRGQHATSTPPKPLCSLIWYVFHTEIAIKGHIKYLIMKS